LAETYPSIRAVIEKSGFAEIESWAAPKAAATSASRQTPSTIVSLS
jgi:hypothetical protein